MSTSEAQGRAAPPGLVEELQRTVGEARVRPLVGRAGVMMVRAACAQGVRGVLGAAKRFGVPILATGPGVDISGIRTPAEGGIVLDLSPMNRTLEINHSKRYALIEPGVTWRALEARLVEEGGDLALPTTAAPHEVGPWASCFLSGMEGAALSLGSIARQVLAVEAVLPDGEVIRTGARASGEAWWGRGPDPDLTAMVLGWRGSTALVTRFSICLNPRRRHIRRLLIPTFGRRAAIAASIRLARTKLFDDAYVIPCSLPRLLLGGAARARSHDGEPDAWLAADFSADNLPELEYKRVRLAHAISRASRRGGRFEDPLSLGDLTRVAPSLDPLEDLPVALSLPGAGPERAPRSRVLGFQGPVSVLVDAAAAAEEAYRRHDVPPIVLVRPLPGGYHGMIHVAAVPAADAPPPSAKEAEHETVSALSGAGLLPFRYPADLYEEVTSGLDPATIALSGRIRETFDPEALLDPARWGLPRPF